MLEGEKENCPPKKSIETEKMWTVEGQISTAATFREIWRSAQIAADVSQVEMADLIPSSCDRKGVHYPHYCPTHTPPPPQTFLRAQRRYRQDAALLRVELKLQFACERPGEKREIGALMMLLGNLRKRFRSAA